MRYDLYLRGKIDSLPSEIREQFDKEVKDYEEDKDALAELGLDPINFTTNELMEALYSRHYDSKTRITNPLPKSAKVHKESA